MRNDTGFENNKIEPVTLIHDILSNWWVILLGAVGAALLASVVVNARYVPQYTAEATFVVASREDSNAYNNWGAVYEMAETLESILKSNTMRKIICQKMGVSTIDAQLSTHIFGETNLLSLRVTAKTSREAIEVMNIVMDNYTEVSYYSLGNCVMDILEEPKVPVYPDNPLDVTGAVKTVFLYTALALILVFGLLSYFRDSIKREEDIENKLDARSLGIIPYEIKNKTLKEMIIRRKKALLINNPIASFKFVEAYTKLATKVDYQMKKYAKKAVVVTSVSENEGKSTVAANLAISLAEQSKKVILIEGDLRRPSQFMIFEKNPEENQEIGEYLAGKARARDLVMKSRIDNLYLILGKNCYSSSTEKIQTKKMTELLEVCAKIADYVIIDSPPAGLLGDAEVFSEISGAVLLVTRQNYVLAEDVNEVLDSFRTHRSNILGVVLNGAKTMNYISENGYGYYGGYGKYGKYTNLRNKGEE